MKSKGNLQIMLCNPGKDYPGNKGIIARIKEGSRPVRYMTFGPSSLVGTIYERIPMLITHPQVRRALRKEA